MYPGRAFYHDSHNKKPRFYPSSKGVILPLHIFKSLKWQSYLRKGIASSCVVKSQTHLFKPCSNISLLLLFLSSPSAEILRQFISIQVKILALIQHTEQSQSYRGSRYLAVHSWQPSSSKRFLRIQNTLFPTQQISHVFPAIFLFFTYAHLWQYFCFKYCVLFVCITLNYSIGKSSL